MYADQKKTNKKKLLSLRSILSIELRENTKEQASHKREMNTPHARSSTKTTWNNHFHADASLKSPCSSSYISIACKPPECITSPLPTLCVKPPEWRRADRVSGDKSISSLLHLRGGEERGDKKKELKNEFKTVYSPFVAAVVFFFNIMAHILHNSQYANLAQLGAVSSA